MKRIETYFLFLLLLSFSVQTLITPNLVTGLVVTILVIAIEFRNWKQGQEDTKLQSLEKKVEDIAGRVVALSLNQSMTRKTFGGTQTEKRPN